MIDHLIRWSLKNRALVLALAAGFLAWGGYVLSTIPVDVLPDLTAPYWWKGTAWPRQRWSRWSLFPLKRR
jgi:Cu/Ag efflux pump CusA